MTKASDYRDSRYDYLTTTPRAMLKPADKATQKMYFDAAIEADPDNAAAYRAAYLVLAPESAKRERDPIAAAAAAQATRKANALARLRSMLPVAPSTEPATTETAATETKQRRTRA